jgi:hypothetical protein
MKKANRGNKRNQKQEQEDVEIEPAEVNQFELG